MMCKTSLKPPRTGVLFLLILLLTQYVLDGTKDLGKVSLRRTGELAERLK